jgi:hypothetical protein
MADDILEIGVKVDVAELRGGMDEAAAIIKSSAEKMRVMLLKDHEQTLAAFNSIESRYRQERQRSDDQEVARRKRTFGDLWSSVSNSFQGALRGMLRGSETLSQAMGRMGEQILVTIASASEKMLERWFADRLAEVLFGKQTAAAGVGTNATVAASAAYASIAAIPIVGPELAPAAAAKAFGEVSAMLSGLAFFEKGGIVPSDQLAYLHKNEMVLPSAIAQRFQNASTGDAGGDVHIHFGGHTINATDAKGVERILKDNERTIVKIIKRQFRNGAFQS